MKNPEAIPSIVRPDADRVSASSWYAVLVLMLIYACHYLDRSVVSIVAEPIRHEFQLSDRQVGLLTGLAYGVSFALAGLPMGYLIDRVNRRRMLAIVVMVWSSMTGLAGVAQNFGTLAMTRLLLGAAEAGGTPTSMAIISDMFPPRRRTTALGIYYLGAGVGSAASAVIAIAVASHYGWRAAFVVAGVPGIVLAALVWLTLKDVPRGGSESTRLVAAAPPFAVTLRFLLRQRAVVALILAVSMAAAGMAAIGAWLPALLMRNHGMTLGKAGFATAVTFGVFSCLGTLVGGIAADRVARAGGAKRQLQFCALMALIAAPAGAFTALATQTPLAIGMAFAAAFAGFVTFPTGFGMAMELMTPGMRGMTTASAQVTSNLVGYGLGPYAVGALSTAIGGVDSLRDGMAIVCAGTMALAAVALLFAARWHGAAMRRCEAFELEESTSGGIPAALR